MSIALPFSSICLMGEWPASSNMRLISRLGDMTDSRNEPFNPSASISSSSVSSVSWSGTSTMTSPSLRAGLTSFMSSRGKNLLAAVRIVSIYSLPSSMHLSLAPSGSLSAMPANSFPTYRRATRPGAASDERMSSSVSTAPLSTFSRAAGFSRTAG